ncbi:tetratricopeptide repeat protein [Thalassotalea piscium]
MHLERKTTFSILSFLLILLLVFIAYSNTFTVPFLFDDITSIVEKQKLYMGDFSSLYHEFAQRIVVYLTFKGNFYFNQLDVFGYHLVNTGIHVVCSFLVYLFTFELVKAHSSITKSNDSLLLNIRWFALFVSLMFALHPLQTQAVTYIVQRTTSLAALFYLATMFSYLKLRVSTHFKGKLFLFVSTIIFFILAILTKQSAFTLPFALILIEIVFIYPITRYSLKLPLILGVLSVGLAAVLLLLNPEILVKIDAASRETLDFTRLAYFETQLTVLLHYVKLFIYPAQLQVEYIYPLADGKLMDSIGYIFLYIFILGVGFYNIRKAPIVSFAVFFFFIAHGIESSFIPISDLVFEHRTYLPNLSLCILFVYLFFKSAPNRTVYIKSVLLVIILFLTFLTYQRNALWNDPEKLYKNELLVNKNKPRMHAMLGEYYRTQKLDKLSASSYKKAFDLAGSFNDLDNQGYDAKFGYFNNYIAALSRYGENKKAIEQTLILLPELKGSKFLALIYVNLGTFYWKEKNYLHCTKYMFQAMKIKPEMIEPVIGVGKCFEEMGDKEMALHMFNKARKMVMAAKQ